MRRALLAVVAAACAGCPSPDDIFVLKGSVVSDTPEGQRVRLLRGKQSEGRAGTAPCDGLRDFKEAVTDAEGRFGFDVFRAQAQSLNDFGSGFCFLVEAGFTSGARATVELPLLFGPVDLPELPDWRSELALDDDAVRFTPVLPLPAEETFAGPQVTHRLEGRLADGSLAWQADDRLFDFAQQALTRATLRFDPAVLVEDEPVTLRLRARVDLPVEGGGGGPFGGGAFVLGYEAEAPEALALPARSSPASRGLPCPPLLEPCPFTDGSFEVLEPVGALTGVSVELPVPATPRWLVVRALETSAPLVGVVGGLSDGGVTAPMQHVLPVSAWAPGFGGGGGVIELPDGGLLPVPGSVAAWTALPLAFDEPVTSVRLSVPLGVDRLAEVSLVE